MADTVETYPLDSLPLTRTELIGREEECAAACSMLLDEAVPLLTFTGPGGVGKTRLALAVAHHALAQFAEGASFIDLAPLVDPDLVAATVAATLAVPSGSGRMVTDAVVMKLRGEQRLLILDNCEHVLTAAAELVAALLAGCPALQILATSRAPLHVCGEQIMPVAPLPVPHVGAMAPEAAQAAAVKLFAQRARATDPAFALNTDSAGAVAEICQRLDGLPLAIELAATRTSLLSPAALLALLNQRLPVLGTGPRDAPARHQTIHEAIAWSYALLSPEEQSLFRTLSVFAGGWTLEAAAAVGALALPVTLTRLGALVDQNLVVRQDNVDATSARFTMLETIREYGLAQLTARGEAPGTRDRHASYFLALAERRDPALPIPGDHRWVARPAPELDNVRLALTWCDEQGSPDLVRLVVALYELWVERGLYSEGRHWFGRALERDESVDHALRGRAYSYAGTLALFQGDYAATAALYDEELALVREVGDEYRIAESLIDLGLLAYRQHEFDRVAARTAEAAGIARRLSDRVPAAAPLAGQALANLGDIALATGDVAGAAARYGEAFVLVTGYHWARSEVHTGLGMVALLRGEARDAAGRFVDGLDYSWGQRNRLLAMSAVLGLAGVATMLGLPERAVRLLGAMEAITAALGAPPVFPQDRHVYDRTLFELRAVLDPERLANLQAEGRALTPDQTVAEARAVASLALATPSPSSRQAPAHPFGLTDREVDVLRLLAAGKTDPQIAQALCVSRRTAEWHVRNVLGKLGAANRAEAATLAARVSLDRSP